MGIAETGPVSSQSETFLRPPCQAGGEIAGVAARERKDATTVGAGEEGPVDRLSHLPIHSKWPNGATVAKGAGVAEEEEGEAHKRPM